MSGYAQDATSYGRGTKRITAQRVTPDGRRLASRRMIGYWSGRNDETVRQRCQPIACDVHNRTPLYDADEALTALAQLRTTRPLLVDAFAVH